jgi:hypothetical protein
MDANEPAQSVIPDLLCIVRGRLTARLVNEQKRIDAARRCDMRACAKKSRRSYPAAKSREETPKKGG